MLLPRQPLFQFRNEVVQRDSEPGANHPKLDDIEAALPPLDLANSRLFERKLLAQLRLGHSGPMANFD
jgi:hypothetical protein